MTRHHWLIALVVAALAIAMAVVALVLYPRLAPPAGSDEGLELAQRSAHALDTVSIRGIVRTIAQTSRGPVETRAEVHRGEGRVVIRYLSGPAKGTVIHRQGEMVWALGPHGRLRRWARLTDSLWRRNLLARNWRFRIVGRSRVAGRPVVVFTGTGPGGELTVSADRETAFPLAIKRKEPDGKLLTASEWESADFSVAPPARMQIPQMAAGGMGSRWERLPIHELQARVDFELLQPRWLPDGFELDGWYLHQGHGGTVVETRYTDGLRPLMILQRQLSIERGNGLRPEPRAGPRQRGGMTRGMRGMAGHGRLMRLRAAAGGRAVRRQIDGVQVVVVGAAPIDQLERIVNSMQPVKAGNR